MATTLTRCIFILLLFLGALSVLHRSNTPQKKPLEFTEQSIAFGSVLAGRHKGILYLRNNEDMPVANIELRTSCFCTGLDRAESIPLLKPHQTVPIPFHVDCLAAVNLLESVTATSRDATATSMIYLHVVSPLQGNASLLSIPKMHRVAMGFTAKSNEVIVPVMPQVLDLKLSPQVSWLHVTASPIINERCHLLFTATGVAPEGKFEILSKTRFRTISGQSEGILPIQGSVVSKTRAVPSCIFFGAVAQGKIVQPISCTVSMNQAVHDTLRVTSDLPDIQVKVLKKYPHQVALQIKLTNKRLGNIQGLLRVINNGNLVVAIPVSCFVLKK